MHFENKLWCYHLPESVKQSVSDNLTLACYNISEFVRIKTLLLFNLIHFRCLVNLNNIQSQTEKLK